jgi:hypothetical protein
MAQTHIVGESGPEIVQLTVTLHLEPKWWMRPALWISCWALKLGLIRDKPSAEHFGGVITAEERVSKWLANYAFRFETHREGFGGY